MAFDAGAIEASLTVHLEQFNKDLDRAEERVRKFEETKHEVKISAVFDSASFSKARKMFADLDQQISRDAATRLRSNPQGSVLGSLNALFSPHPVTGSPTAQQSGQQGLLGRMFNTPGGGGGNVGGGSNNRGGIFGGGGFLSGLFGRFGGGGASADKAASDAAAAQTAAAKSMADSAKQTADEAKKQTSILQRALGGDRSAGGFGKGLAGGIGPGILGLSMANAAKVGLGGSLLAAVPAALTGAGALGIAGVGLGASAALFKGVQSQISPISQAYTQAQTALAAATTPQQLKAAQQQMQGVQQQINGLSPALQTIFKSEQQIQNTWQSFTASFAPVFAAALGSAAQVFTKLQGPLQGFFTNATKLIQPFIQGIGDLAGQVLPLLGQAFAAVGPLMRPMLDGIAGLLTGLLPGLITALKGAQPAVNALFGGLAIIGKGLGQMFAAFAPAIKASAIILNSLLSVLSAIFPIVGQLASIFATALAPVFQAFAGTIKSLLPFLTIVGQILASLASAVLGDLVSAFTALAQLLTDISPSLKIVADVLGQVFNTLENSGVFAVIGNALEGIVPPLAQLINLLVSQLAPLLPVIIGLVSQFATILVDLLAAGLATILQGITWLVKTMPWLVPLLVSVTAAVWAFNLALDANPIGLVIIAVVALVGAITLLVKHWGQVWHDIKQWAEDAWNFIYNGFGKYLLPLLGPAGLIALGVIELAKHWSTVWGAIKQVGLDFYQWIWKDFGAKIANFLTVTLPNAFDSAVKAIGKIWGGIEDVFKTPANFLINTVYDNGIRRFWNDVVNAIGLSNLDLPEVKGLAHGGRITDGSGPTADDVLIRASRGETVISARHSKLLAPVLAAVGVPGYQGGGIIGGLESLVGGIGSAFSLLTGGTSGLVDELLKFVGLPHGVGGELAKMITGMPTALVHKIVDWGLGKLIFGGGPESQTGGYPSANAALARKMVPAAWASGANWAGLNYVAMAESGWSNFAMNPSSGAYGIPQALPYTKMPKAAWPASAGGKSDAATQIAWFISYIMGRYGNPIAAMLHEQQFHWYGNGLDAVFSHPTVIGVGERGPEAVSVTPLASFGRRGGTMADTISQLIAAVRNERPMIGTYQTAYYGTGDTAYALRELTRTLRMADLQATVVGP